MPGSVLRALLSNSDSSHILSTYCVCYRLSGITLSPHLWHICYETGLKAVTDVGPHGPCVFWTPHTLSPLCSKCAPLISHSILKTLSGWSDHPSSLRPCSRWGNGCQSPSACFSIITFLTPGCQTPPTRGAFHRSPPTLQMSKLRPQTSRLPSQGHVARAGI